jgi:hypothetical protein
MINFLIYLLIGSLFVFDWLFFRYDIGIRPMTWIPEIISIILAVSIPFRTAITKESHLPIKYTFLLILYIAHLAIGFLLNDISGWTILSGVRIYAKFIPIFLLPLIFPFTEQNFKKIVFLIFILAMIQLPVVLWQRFIEYAGKISGDPMGGTLGTHASGILSIFQLIIISFIIAFYFKKEISLPVFLLASAVVFIPITLNETKITFILLPATLIFPALFIKGQRKSIFRIFLVGLILFGSFFVLKSIYNYFQKQKWGYGIETFVTMPGRLENYSRYRLDPILYSFPNATKELRFFIFGRGAGNVSEGFTKRLSGKYSNEGKYFGATNVSFTKSIWEIGIFGTVLFFLFPFFIFMDAVGLCKKDGFIGSFSLGMLTFSVFFSISSFYTKTFDQNIFIYLFFLSAGYIVSRQYAFADDEKDQI